MAASRSVGMAGKCMVLIGVVDVWREEKNILKGEFLKGKERRIYALDFEVEEASYGGHSVYAPLFWDRGLYTDVLGLV